MNTYNAVILIQSLSILILAVGAIYLISNWRGKEHSYLVLFCIVTLINNIGALIEIMGLDREQILIGTKFSYVGKVFIPLTFFLFVMQYCEIQIPGKVKLFLALFHLSIAMMVFTYPLQTWFYTDVWFSTDGLFPHNSYGHGVMYNVYTACLVLYFFVVFAVVVGILRKEKRRKRRVQMYYMLACACCAIAGFVIFLLDLTGGYDTTSLSYAICTIFMAIALAKYDLLDTVELARNYVIDNLSLGIIALDEDDRIIYFNRPVQEIYPELKGNGNAIVKNLISICEEKGTVELGEKVYKPEYRVLSSNDKYRGHIITLSDITDNYNYTQLMKKMTEMDPLTGLFNRFAYEYRISEIKKTGNWSDHLILFAMDLNGLKNVNDSKGHDAGDAMIYAASQCILRGVGNAGECYRVGGDEFAVIIMDHEADPHAIKQRIEQEAAACHSDNYSISISIGYCMGKEIDELCLEDLEKLADERMYQDKENYYIEKGVNRRAKDEDFRTICDSYLKILKVDLETGAFDIIRMDVREKETVCGFSRDFRTWGKDLVRCHMVHEDDVERFLEKVDLDALRKQFAEDKTQIVRMTYKRRVMDSYHKVMLEIVPDKEYGENKPIAFLFVKDIE